MIERKINIGLFIDTFYPMVDGVINVVDNYARRLDKIANVTVFCPKTRRPFDDTILPYKVVRCNMLNGSILNIDYDIPMPLISKDFQTDLKNANLDIIHIHSPFALGNTAVNYAKKNNIPVIATMHSQIEQDFMRTTNSKVVTNMLLKHCMKIYNACDVCFAVNDTISDIYLEYGASVKPKVLQNGTDFSYIKENINQEINKQFKLDPSKPLLLFVGRINKLKNIFFIAKVLKILKDKAIDFQMMFVGEGVDLEEFKTYITKLNLDDHVIFAGKITSRELLAKIYKRAELFLFPSMYDANSLVQIEAASQKTPTLFLQGSATSSTAKNEINALIIENSPELYAKKIIELLKNKDYYQRISEKAYEDLFLSWDKVVNNAYKIYVDLINNR